MPLASFFRTTVAGGKLMVWQQMVMFCPSGTTAEGRMRMVVFLGGAGPQEESFSRKDRDLLLQFFFWPAGGAGGKSTILGEEKKQKAAWF